MIEVPGVKDEWWRRRVLFLESRANAHLEEPSDLLRHGACAATLLRDAGCLSLLREDFEAGRQYLTRAGKRLLDLGLPAGLPLIALFDPVGAQEEAGRYRRRVEAVGRSGVGDKVDTRDSADATALAARGSFRSMLSVVQADQIGATVDSVAREGRERREAERIELGRRHGFRQVGGTGLSTARYLLVCGWMEGARASRPSDGMPDDVGRVVELLGRHREAQIEAARRDDFHWRLVPRPAELLDLDSVVLMRLALDAGYPRNAMIAWLGWSGDEVLGAPLEVAARLRRSGRDLGPGLTH